MSAAVVAQDALSRPAPARRDHLRLVAPDEVAPTPVGGALRLTRRGRLAVTTSVALTIAVVATTLVLLMAPAGASAEVVVERGQTLSELAATHLPDLPLDRAVVQIQVANSLSTSQVQAGQTLLIPGS